VIIAMINHTELITKARCKMTVIKKAEKSTRTDKLCVLLCLLLAAVLSTCQKVPEYCVKKAVYDPDCQFCFGDKAYDLCGGMSYNPLTQGCIDTTVVGTKCLDGSVVPFGTPCDGYTVKIDVIPEGGGVIYTSKYANADTVVLTAKPKDGYELVGWAGTNARPTPELTLKVPTNRNNKFAAIFKPVYTADDDSTLAPTFTLITAAFTEMGGRLYRKPDGGPDSVAGIYAAGTAVTVTAKPSEGYEFVKWLGASTAESPTVKIKEMDDNKTLVAVFKPKTPALLLTVNAKPADAGTVYVNGTAMSGTTLMGFGTEIKAVAVPADGYAFDRWLERANYADSTEFTINAVMREKNGLTLTAKFIKGTMPPPPLAPRTR
jgi:uncharacterized repeat protein (TIGR02543 family)